MNKILFLVVFILFISACTSGRYSDRHDSAPTRPPTQLELTDPIVQHEPVGRGNAPYTVWGKSYTPMTTRQPFSQEGTASWYGKKFHGHLTSNGETYNMYGMSAAHKTLPLPSYVRVTNTDNNKSVIVRVNDRGPFHGDRIIDLSYSAAYKIGVFDTGTAHVRVELILPEEDNKQFELMFGEFVHHHEAEETQKGLALLINQEVNIKKEGNKHFLAMGPFASENEALETADKIKQFGIGNFAVKAIP
jgi:rare lipoprotein A